MDKKDELLKSDILKMKYTKDTPKVKEKNVKKQIKKYLLNSIPVDTKFLMLNSRKLNFIQIFDISDKYIDADFVTNFLYDYLRETSYMFEAKTYSMTDIKDIYEEGRILNIYYAPVKGELIDFILVPANDLVEKVKGEDE